jgi:hypothetical protein
MCLGENLGQSISPRLLDLFEPAIGFLRIAKRFQVPCKAGLARAVGDEE